MPELRLTPQLIDQLALESLSVVRDARKENAYDYDITGYLRVTRRDTPFGAFSIWDISTEQTVSPGFRQECSLNHPYVIRLGGMERGLIYAPDAIGKLLREHSVLYSDGPGNGKLESLMVARKYGLHSVFEAAPWNLPLPITRAQMTRFAAGWEREVLYIRRWCESLGGVLGVDLVNDSEQLWIVLAGEDVQPLDIFLDRVRENYDEVNADFRHEYGHNLPIFDTARQPQHRAQRIRLWEYIHRRYSELARIETEVLRRHVKGKMVANLEFDTEIDYRLWGEAYDIPGFNLRVTLFDNEIGYRYWVGYGTRLSADLTHRAPMISVRTNQVAAGPRVVPTPAATRYWYSQAIQNGAVGFYLWIRDFQGDTRDPQAYSGPCMANPDPSARGQERWATHLEIAQRLGRTRVFQPPQAESGILVSLPSCASGGWPSVFSAYIETVRARIFSRFISSTELHERASPLSRLRLLFVPLAPFEHRAVIERLREAVHAGLTLVIAGPQSFTYDEHGAKNDAGQSLMGIDGVVGRLGCESATLEFEGQPYTFRTYGPGCVLVPAAGSQAIGHFTSDHAVAIVEHRLGIGRVITFGAPLLDLYAAGVRDLSEEEQGRYPVLRRLHELSGAADHSWVLDVNLENLSTVTGELVVPIRPIDESIEFAPFLYVHGGDTVR